MRAAMAAVRDADRRVAFTLSDRFCVERHHDEFLELLNGTVDILFANESEACAMFETDDVEKAFEELRGRCRIAAVTRSEKGSVVIAGADTIVVPAEPVAKVVDTTGAGDLYAAGFLLGLARGRSLEECGVLGGIGAAEVISHVGPRPMTRLADLAR